MRWSGMPMAMSSCEAGMLTPDIDSLTGCSTCRRGLSSRKKNSPVSIAYRYSHVAAPTYPTCLASAQAAFSIERSTSSGAIVAGPSSMIFWWRRCTEQSRVCSAHTPPCLSQSSCTSRCLLLGASFMTKMGLRGTSPATCGNIVRTSSSPCARRIPFPPPPQLALIMTGYPMALHARTHDSASSTHADRYTSSGISMVLLWNSTFEPLHGMVGTPAACASMLEPTLSPSAAIGPLGGPRKAISASSSAVGRDGSSDACPQPGQTASAPTRRAVATMRRTFA
mmetsp:Transcript_5828/g.15006  ORF Transcript_5828/g.15006 Transcript_5828/m.15006 type:complete len:281 (-) Transcript_5828:643-1485(-)